MQDLKKKFNLIRKVVPLTYGFYVKTKRNIFETKKNSQ